MKEKVNLNSDSIKETWKPWQLLIFIFILFLGFMGFWGFIGFLIKQFFAFLTQSKLTSEGVTLIGVGITALVGVISSIIIKWLERRNLILQQLREKKISIYERFLEFLFNVIYRNKGINMLKEDNERLRKEIIDFYKNNLHNLLLWSESAVIKSYSELFQSTKTAIEKPEELIRKFEQFIKAIRKDLGYKNLNLKEGELLKTFIIDIEQVLKNK